MKRFFTAMAIVTMMAAPVAFSQNNYISDELFTYLHSGPGTKYRIIGSVDAGTKIAILSSARDTEYTQIKDDRGRKGWIESKYITKKAGLKIRVPALEAELKEVKTSLSRAQKNAQEKNQGLIESLARRTSQVNDLELFTRELNQQLIDAQSEIRELSARIDTQKDDLLMRYFTYGGLVAGIGLLFGLVLPHVIPRRRKNQSGWA